MFVCPNCTQRLAYQINPSGRSWRCGTCGGVAVPVSTLRKTPVPSAILDGLLESARAGEGIQAHFCPICANWMAALTVAVDKESVTIDVCNRCGILWFDPKEFEQVSAPAPAPETTPAPAPLPPQVETPIKPPDFAALQQRAHVEDEALEGYEAEIRLRWWNYIPGLFGMPVESRSPKRLSAPVATRLLALVIALASLAAFIDFPAAAQALGFVPAQALRYGGVTFLTSMFLHGGILHLAGNLYFLVTFGDNVEDFLGVRRYLLLILTAGVFGDVAQYVTNPGSTMVVIGSSGGIAGLLAFYGLQFRQARVAIFLLRLIPVKLGAVWALILWVAFQILGAASGGMEIDQIAYSAHLGGAAVGFAFWYAFRKA